MLLQSYASLADIEKVFKVYADSDDYQTIISSGKMQVVSRNIVKLEKVDVSKSSADMPKYGVLTRYSGALMMDRMPDLIPLWEQNGAMKFRYGTLITGSNAGKRTLAVGFPSMAAVEKTYDALRASPVFQKVMSEIDIDFRNIVRITG